MDISFGDGKRLWTIMWHKEEMIMKKRRLLMGPVKTSLPKGNLKKFKVLEVMADMYLPESYARDDEINSEIIRTTVEGSFVRDVNRSHPVVRNYLQLFQIHNHESNCNNPLRLKQLKNDATFPGYYPKTNFKHKNPTSRFCLASFNSLLEALDTMSYQELVATNRKLRGVSLVPQFPLPRYSGSRAVLLDVLKRKFKKFQSTCKDGDELPENLLKALSVIYLSFKQRSRHIDVLISEFYPFSPEIACLHNKLINALWLLPKVEYDELKNVQHLLDPKAVVPSIRFRKALEKYLKEYLFECDEVSITQEALMTLDFINTRMQKHALLFSNSTLHEEVEAVMNLSCQLKQIISSPFSDHSDDDQPLLEGFENVENIDSFNLHENGYFLNYVDNGFGQDYGSSNYETEVVEHAGLIISSSMTSNRNYLISGAANETCETLSNKPEFVHDENADAISGNTGCMREKSVQEVLDETASVAYNLIGSMLDKLLKTEGIEADLLTRSYLNGGSSDPEFKKGAEEILKTSKDNVRSRIFVQTVEELVPSLTGSCVRRVKNFLDV